MELPHLLNAAENYKESFGAKDNKYVGALSVELIKLALRENGIVTSARDVFIRGVPLEIDLLIPSADAKPDYGLVYRPEEVSAVLEIKTRGCYGEKALNAIRAAFDLIRKTNPRIGCAYVTLTELKRYKYAVSEENLGHNAFTFAWHTREHMKPGKWPSTPEEWQKLVTPGEWDRFLDWVKGQGAGR